MEKTKNITKEELKYLIVAEESAKSKEERFRYFEHTLECLFFGLDTPTDREDDFLVSDIKQSIIVFAMADECGEKSEIFLENKRNDFYNALKKLEERHPDISSKMLFIKLFMEDFYFKK